MPGQSSEWVSSIQSAREALSKVTSGSGGLPAGIRERRRLIRIPCNLGVHYKRGGIVYEGVIRDLSLGGARLFATGIQVQDELEISPVGEEDWVPGKVVWWNEDAGMGGVQFTAEPEDLGRSWIVDRLCSLGLDAGKVLNRRRFTRIEIVLEVELEVENYRGRGTLRDLGLGGALVLVEHPLPMGSEGILKMHLDLDSDTLRLPFRVLACRSEEAGWVHNVEFRNLIPDATRRLGRVLVDLIRRKRG